MARVVKQWLERLGYYVRPIRTLPRGIDWLRDIERILFPTIPNCIFDVGANIGDTSCLFKTRFPFAAVHSFEPVPSSFESLKARTSNLQGVVCHQLALANREADEKIRVIPLHQANSLKPLRNSKHENAVEVPVRVTTLDQFVREYQIERIDILKSDTEGGDIDVIDGATKTFEEGRIASIYVEATFDPKDAQHSNFFETHSRLSKYGFTLAGIYEVDALQTRNPWGESYCNALFVLESLIPALKAHP